jgi:hypothetical protein
MLMLSRILVVFLLFLTITSSAPVAFSGGEKPGKGPKIPVPQLYRNLTINEIPTTIAKGLILQLKDQGETKIRYGYFVGRPVSRIFRGALAQYVLTIIVKILAKMPPFLHWAILITEEPPETFNGKLPKPGTKVPRPETGIVFELRNSAKTGLIYLDIRDWDTYLFRQDKLEFLGSLNKTNEEIITIGRAYIQHLALGGFHNFYRNCQHFTSWYAKALWPEYSKSPTRVDQLLGKFLWWFRDWKKTVVWGVGKIRHWLGYQIEKVEEVDSSTDFVEMTEIMKGDSKSVSEDDKT